MAANKVVYGTLVLMDLTKDTVTADQMPNGCTAHDKSGNQITGTVTKATWMSLNTSNVTKNDTKVTLTAKMPANRFMEENATMEVSTLATNLGDASASDVVKGKTFTSSAGVKVTGTHTDLDTSDATATAARICNGDTAYVKGSKITGTLPFTAKQKDKAMTADYTLSDDSNVVLSTYIGNTNTATNPPFAMLGDNTLTVSSAKSNFGDATASDVKKGKTFTSSAGLKVSGTLAEGTPTASYDNARKMSYRETQSSVAGTLRIIDIPVKVSAGDTPIIASGTTEATISTSGSNFGNATAADVAKGKTFTSTYGVLLTGTATSSGGGSSSSSAAFGSVTPGSDGSCTINTGLSSVSKFTLVYDGAASASTTGCYAVYYSNGTAHGLGWTRSGSSYFQQTTASSEAPNVSISGGTITIAAGTNATKLAAHAYMWSASA